MLKALLESAPPAERRTMCRTPAASAAAMASPAEIYWIDGSSGGVTQDGCVRVLPDTGHFASRAFGVTEVHSMSFDRMQSLGIEVLFIRKS